MVSQREQTQNQTGTVPRPVVFTTCKAQVLLQPCRWPTGVRSMGVHGNAGYPGRHALKGLKMSSPRPDLPDLELGFFGFADALQLVGNETAKNIRFCDGTMMGTN